MSEHTPGPWNVCEDGTNVYAPASDTAITNQTSFCYPDEDEARANARLVAAAPEMFAALGVITLDPRIRSWLEVNDPKALAQADAAFAKAKRD